MKKNSQFIWMDDDNGQQQDDSWQPIVHVKKTKKVKTNKREFVGWGSKQLIHFLDSIGVDTANKLSQDQVADIINKYISTNNLINPTKKKRVICDEKLHMLFGRKTVGRIKIYDLLETHLAENLENSASNDDKIPYSSDDDISPTPKRKEVASGAEKKTLKKVKLEKQANNDSCFAEVIPENIKLVYLKKSLVQELLKDLETFEEKLSGTFVRIKSDPHDFTQKNKYQLVRVTGIKKRTGIEDLEKQLLLNVSNSINDISITMLSDEDFSKEECEDLKSRIKEGLLERLTVDEVTQKAQTLHQDITKHWITKELVRLQHLIDRANEKGWRRELSDYIDRKMLLQIPTEQTRLLQESPRVIAEKIVPELASEATPVAEPKPEEVIVPESAKNTDLFDDSDYEDDDWFDSFLQIAEESRAKASHANGKTTESDPAPAFKPEFSAAEEQENMTAESDVPTVAKLSKNEGIQDAMPTLVVIAEDESNREVPVESPKRETTVSIPNDQLVTPRTDITAESLKTNLSLPKVDGKLPSPFANLKVSTEDLVSSADLVAESVKHKTPVSNGTQGIPAVIELSDDDDEELTTTRSGFSEQPESLIWHYRDPQGAVQGPFSLLSMKQWADANYFQPGFVVWKKGIPNVKYALAEVLRQYFSNHGRSRIS